MPTIENLKINGLSGFDNKIIEIGMPPIMIFWSHNDIQQQYQLRIRNDATNLGNDSFVGNMISIDEYNSVNTYIYTLKNLERNTIYSGQVRIKGELGTWSSWFTFSFKTNRIPTVTGFSLSPSNPSSGDDIQLSYTFVDLDNHDESGTQIRWFKNNILQSVYNNLTILPSSATQPGDSWTAKIIPSDGIEFGVISETTAVTVSMPDISADNITILPANPNVDDILKVEYTLQSNDEYNPSEILGIVSFEWYVNGVAIPDSNLQYMRLDLSPLDLVHVVITVTDGTAIVLQQSSDQIEIQDVPWYIYNLLIDGLSEVINLTSLQPVLTWEIHKTTASLNERPDLLRVLITKTLSKDCSIYDTGFIGYTKDSFLIPNNVLENGKDYFIHVGVKNNEGEYIDPYNPITPSYVTKKIHIAGSSWLNNVDNTKGWTIELRAKLDDINQKLGIYIHDGFYFCSLIFLNKQITFYSDESIDYTIPSDQKDFTEFRNLKISAKNQDIKIFLDNIPIIDGIGVLTNKSKLKIIEYGDIDGKQENKGTFAFVRYSTDGAYNFGDNLENENKLCFSSIGEIEGGSITYIKNDLLSWMPNNDTDSSKIIQFTESGEERIFPTVPKNLSPITTIYIDRNRNKYIGTSNGVNGIFGEKHNPDYELLTNNFTSLPSIPSNNFDLISTVPNDRLSFVEPDVKDGWLTINTTYESIFGSILNEYGAIDEYASPTSHAIHYYSQRVHGHSWFDNVDNSKGWQITFSFKLDELEQDNFVEENLPRDGFGVYINDGTYQEILYFYYDRIRLFYANVYVLLPMTVSRDLRIVGKDQNLFIYQKPNGAPISTYTMAVDGTGLFTTPASPAANSKKPKTVLDSAGFCHSVWHDDGNRRSQILYSMFDGTSWSSPQVVTESNSFSLRNPSIDIDSQDRIWIAYEDTSWEETEISVSMKDNIGWNPKIRITNNPHKKAHPCLRVDSIDDVYVVWEDYRNGPSEIYAAQWHNNGQYWTSSGQFDNDELIMTANQDDPYQAGQSVYFKNPQLSLDFPKMWIVCEGRLRDNNQKDYSIIYRGWKDLVNNFWWGSGNPVTTDGVTTGVFEPFISSPTSRQCVNPSISALPQTGILIITWEDQTEPISQIWGSLYNVSNLEIQEPQQITNRVSSCSNPSVGWVNGQGVIAYEHNNNIYTSFVLGINSTFYGSATGGEDRKIITSNAVPKNPTMPPISASKTFRILYDYPNETTDVYSDRLKELAEFFLIGNVTVNHDAILPSLTTTTTSTIGDGIVSSVDTKEFAFGDFSDNIGINSHWKDFQMYFGYDARPHSIVPFNTSSVTGWPDNRINDIFVDAWGNMVVATFGGLVYHNTSTGESITITGSSSIDGSIITAIAWGGNGIWYVGSTTGGAYSNNAGETWNDFSTISNKVVNAISITKKGEAIYGTKDGIYIVKPGQETVSITASAGIPYSDIKTVAVDENNIIWAGTDFGLIRIEDLSNFILFNSKTGMKSSHVNDIAIVNNNLRYIATASGVERMYGTQFSNLKVINKNLINDNISSIQWVNETSSLWVSSLGSLYEIVFKDPAHEIIENEAIEYSTNDILSDDNSDRENYFILNKEIIQSDPSNSVDSEYNNTVFINKNPISIGYIVDPNSQFIRFFTSLLKRDQVELLLSTKLLEFHNFNQSDIEKSVIGEKRSKITKIDNTSLNQLLFLSNLDKNQLLLYGGETNLPFTTVLLDRDLPKGCLQQIDTLTRTQIKFKLVTEDKHSGIDGYILSNFENFTSDGSTALDFTSLTSNIITHDLSDQITNISDSIMFPTTDTIGSTTYNIGSGSAIGKWFNQSNNIEYLFAGTSSPAMIYKYDPSVDTWTLLSSLDDIDSQREIHKIYTSNNVIYVATGSNAAGSLGKVYKSTNGTDFELVSGTITGQHIYSVISTVDGQVYFGSSDGKIYLYNNISSSLELKYQNIGGFVYSLTVFSNTLIAGTSLGRIYTIDLTSGDNLIIYDGSDSHIAEVHVKNFETAVDPKSASLYAASGEFTTIYRSDLESYDFNKSYNSLGKSIRRMKDILYGTLQERTDTESPTPTDDTNVVASIGDSLFKHISPTWEFVYKHDEEIKDFIPYTTSGVEGIFVISDSKVTKWTGVLTKKTVYLKLRDKAGNVSSPPDTSIDCPINSTDFCCNYAYAINISNLKGWINESRIVNIDEYGAIQFSYDSPNNQSIYSANKIDEEIGVYTSDILNGSNNLVSWKSLTWISFEPSGTSIVFQTRSSSLKDSITDQEWSSNLIKNSQGIVNIEHITDQYIQFRAILKSDVRDLSPTLSSITLRSITAKSTHFFTTNFILPSRPIKGLLTSNEFLPVSSDIVFGIGTKNSVNFSDYQIIEPNKIFTSDNTQFGNNLRIGAKLISPSISLTTDEYSPSSINNNCTINIDYVNTESDGLFHFRIKFYSDSTRTQEVYTFFSGNDQFGWSSGGNSFPATGISVGSGSLASVKFNAFDQVSTDTRFYLIIESYSITSGTFTLLSDSESYICNECVVQFEPGLRAEYYKTGLSSNLTQIPDFGTLIPDYNLIDDDINFGVINNTAWTTSKGQVLSTFTDNYSIRFLGNIYIPENGIYIFELTSDDGSQLYIDNTLVIDHDGVHGFTNQSGSIELTTGYHSIIVMYFEGDGSSAGLQLKWTTPSEAKSLIPSGRLFHAVDNPYCNPEDVPTIYNFAVVFETEDGQTVKLNLN